MAYIRNSRWSGEFFVYEISGGGRVRYVGMAKNPYARVMRHLAGGDWLTGGRRTQVHRWISAAVRSGRGFGMSVVSRHDNYDDAHAEEVRRIRMHERRGTMLNQNCKRVPDAERIRDLASVAEMNAIDAAAAIKLWGMNRAGTDPTPAVVGMLEYLESIRRRSVAV